MQMNASLIPIPKFIKKQEKDGIINVYVDYPNKPIYELRYKLLEYNDTIDNKTWKICNNNVIKLRDCSKYINYTIYIAIYNKYSKILGKMAVKKILD